MLFTTRHKILSLRLKSFNPQSNVGLKANLALIQNYGNFHFKEFEFRMVQKRNPFAVVQFIFSIGKTFHTCTHTHTHTHAHAHTLSHTYTHTHKHNFCTILGDMEKKGSLNSFTSAMKKKMSTNVTI